MITFALGELVQCAQAQLIVGSKFQGSAQQLKISQISTSSREIGQACLFVPLKGERFDGHTFIYDALAKGAVACLTQMTSDELLETCPQEHRAELEKCLEFSVLVLVKDTLKAYGLCGQMVRRKCSASIGAITGSCGKTTTKEMAAAILQECGKTLYTEANFNNDVGVPLTLQRLDPSYKYAIIEQGASHLEDIDRTAELVEADFALITNVGEAHIAGFGSREGVYHGKSEILDRLFALHPEVNTTVVVDQTAGAYGSTACANGAAATTTTTTIVSKVKNAGIGIVPADSPWFAKWKEDYAKQFASGQMLSFGSGAEATVQYSNVHEDNGRLYFHLTSHDARWPLDVDVSLDILGKHNVSNAAAATLLALVMGASAKEVVNGLQHYHSMQGRLSLIKSANGMLTVIDDAYNASFNAVIAAIDTLHSQKGLRIFIFGDMGELGDAEIELHTKVGEYAKGKIDLFLCVGPLAQYSAEAMRNQALHFTQHEALLNFLFSIIEEHKEAAQSEHIPKDKAAVICLVKGSHAMHMDKIVNALKDYIVKMDKA